MTLQEKKQVIIDQIQKETSENIIDRITMDYTNIKSWDSEYGQDILCRLLEQSQQEARDGKTHSLESVKAMIKERLATHKLAV